MRGTRSWHDIRPADAVDINLSKDLTVDAPLNEAGERCPWPWEPQQLVGVPLGQYHCGYCGAGVVAGIPHLDYRPCRRCGAAYDDLPGCQCRAGAVEPHDEGTSYCTSLPGDCPLHPSRPFRCWNCGSGITADQELAAGDGCPGFVLGNSARWSERHSNAAITHGGAG